MSVPYPPSLGRRGALEVHGGFLWVQFHSQFCLSVLGCVFFYVGRRLAP